MQGIVKEKVFGCAFESCREVFEREWKGRTTPYSGSGLGPVDILEVGPEQKWSMSG